MRRTDDANITIPRFLWESKKETIASLKQDVEVLSVSLKVEQARLRELRERTALDSKIKTTGVKRFGMVKWQLIITSYWTSSEPDGSTFSESDSRYKYYVVPDEYTEQDVINYHLSGEPDGKTPISVDLANDSDCSFEAQVYPWDKKEI